VANPNVGQLTFTAYEYLARFAASERAAIWQAAQTDAVVADLLMSLLAAQTVDNNDPQTLAGMAYAVSVGLLTQARADEILGLAPDPA